MTIRERAYNHVKRHSRKYLAGLCATASATVLTAAIAHPEARGFVADCYDLAISQLRDKSSAALYDEFQSLDLKDPVDQARKDVLLGKFIGDSQEIGKCGSRMAHRNSQ